MRNLPRIAAIAFAMQSIQKRLPKVIAPLLGGFLFAFGFWMNLSAALAVLILAIVIQMILLKRMKPKNEGTAAPIGQLLKQMPPELRQLRRSDRAWLEEAETRRPALHCTASACRPRFPGAAAGLGRGEK